MTEDQLKKQKEQELIVNFMEEFHSQMGYYPTVITGENVMNKEFMFKISLSELEKHFDNYLPVLYGKIITITSSKRIRPIVELRCIFSFIAKCMGYGLVEIGGFMGKDHTTILHQIKTFNNLYETQENFRDMYYRIANIIKKSHESSILEHTTKVEN